MVDPS